MAALLLLAALSAGLVAATRARVILTTGFGRSSRVQTEAWSTGRRRQDR
jgi:hypothetical protein